jgi:hypothetical protein
MGAKTRLGFGGFMTNEGASTSITGTNNGDFKIDDTSTLAPAASGAGTYGAAWTQSGGATSYTLTGASGIIYAVTVQTGKIHIATRNGAPTHADSNNDPDRTELYMTIRRSTAGGGPALGDDIVWQNGSVYNPTSALWYLEPLTIANYTGSGRITIRSETPDTGTDANGNPRLQHGAKMGMVYFNGDSVAAYPIDFRDIWWFTDQPTPVTAIFFQYAQSGTSGVSFYNSRCELGPDVSIPNNNGGFRCAGSSTVDGCHFLNMGDPACITMTMSVVPGAATISNNIFEGIYSDAIDIDGSGVTITRNFGFGWAKQAGNHQDPVQYTGSASSQTLGAMTQNIFCNDLGGNLQSGFFLSDQTGGFLGGGNLKNNIISMGNTHGITLDHADAPIIQYNTVLVDPLVQPLNLVNNLIELTSTGQNGATITGNAVNAVSTGTQPGTITLDNALLPIGSLTSAQIVAMYQVAMPNYPGNNTDARWKTRAGVLNIFTPADLAVGSGGFKKVGGTFYGALFPAPSGYPNGPWNDGSVYQPLDATWLSNHPAAT